MKRLHTALVAAALGLALAGPALAIDAGQTAPDIELATAAGSRTLSSFKGKVVYLDFWASWCGPCRESFPFMNEMQTKYGAKGLQIVGVNLDAKKADADKFLVEVPATFTVAFDAKGQSAKTYAIKGMPSSVLIGADGKVLAVHQGFKAEDRAALEAKLSAAVAAASK